MPAEWPAISRNRSFLLFVCSSAYSYGIFESKLWSLQFSQKANEKTSIIFVKASKKWSNEKGTIMNGPICVKKYSDKF